MSNVIYEPKGKAREYSPLALNLYMGCSHRCDYCYAPSAIQKYKESYFNYKEPRKNVIENLQKQLKKQVPKEQVLLSFIGDVYGDTSDNNETTRESLKILRDHRVPVAILTKAGTKALKDLDIFKEFGEHIAIGSSLTFKDERMSLELEKGAALPSDRIELLRKAKENNIKTFASFEPVIDPQQSIELIKEILPFCDVFKVGKINNYKGIDKQIDWTSFLEEVVLILRNAKKQFYIKHDLRIAAPSVRLYGNEVLCDEHNVR